MTSGTMNTANRLERAQARLDKALNRLEKAVAGKEEQQRQDGENGVSGEVLRLQEENAALRETTHTVGRRLDTTIGRLKTILDS